jgi:hypothetical protein
LLHFFPFLVVSSTSSPFWAAVTQFVRLKEINFLHSGVWDIQGQKASIWQGPFCYVIAWQKVEGQGSKCQKKKNSKKGPNLLS